MGITGHLGRKPNDLSDAQLIREGQICMGSSSGTRFWAELSVLGDEFDGEEQNWGQRKQEDVDPLAKH